MIRKLTVSLVALMIGTLAVQAQAKDLRLSSPLSKTHMYVYGYMDPFADKVEKGTNGEITFTRFYAGELLPIGRAYAGLKGHTVDVVAPVIGAQNEGRFPLSEITQLPVNNTTTVAVAKAYQKLLGSDVKLSNGKTYYETEISGQGFVGWVAGITGPYQISTTGKEVKKPSDFKGMPMRAGSLLHTLLMEELGSTPVTMPGTQAYEALSRKTIEGIVLSIGDWKGYSLTEVLKYTISGVSAGHFSSYNLMGQDVWDGLTDQQKTVWNKAAMDAAIECAQVVDNLDKEVKMIAEKAGSKFVDLADLPVDLQAHIAMAGTRTWTKWIEKMEGMGSPARSASKLWAELIVAEGGELPKGVAEYLGM